MTKPYKTVLRGGERARVPVTSKEMKAAIMKANRWTESQYRKNYDIFKLKLRSYEAYKKAHGVAVDAQSPVAVLYAQAKAKLSAQRAGRAYMPSIKMKTIQSFRAYNKKDRERVAREKGTRGAEAQRASFAEAISSAYGNFAAAHPEQFSQLMQRYGENPAMLEKALGAYAERVKAARDEQGAAMPDDGVPIQWGEAAGSPDNVNIDWDEIERSLTEE